MQALEERRASHMRVLLFTDSTLKWVNQAIGRSHACYDHNGNEVRALVVPSAALCRKKKAFLRPIPFISPNHVMWLWEACRWGNQDSDYDFVMGMTKVQKEDFIGQRAGGSERSLT